MPKLPKRFVEFTKSYPAIANTYDRLGRAVHGAGPLNEKTRALIKVAISIGARLEGGAHSHVRKALEAGAKKEELYQIALLAIQTIGFPAAMAGMSWIDDVMKGRRRKK